MAEQFLSDYNTPAINGIDAKRVLANEVLKNIFQGLIENEGKGVTQRFTNDTTGAQIRIIRQIPVGIMARELGSSVNGGNFNSKGQGIRTTSYGVDVITTIDENVDIAQSSMDMIPVDLLGNSVKVIGDLINLNVNAMTIAGKYLASSGNALTYDTASTNPKALQGQMLEFNGMLDDGDEDHGVAMFPNDDRCIVLKTNYRAKLKLDGVLVLGGANTAYEILEKDGISRGATTNKIVNGYCGDFDGIPVHVAGKQIWTLAEKYAGLPNGELAPVVAYASSGFANVRAIAKNETIKIIDNPNGQGVRIQPLYRMGFNALYPKGNVFLYADKESDAVALLKKYLTGKGVNAVVKAPGSRYTNKLVANATGKTVTATLGSYVEDGVVIGTAQSEVTKYVWIKDGAKVLPTLVNFDEAASKTGAQTGDFTSGTAVTEPATAGTYTLFALLIDDLGTATVVKSADTFTKK